MVTFVVLPAGRTRVSFSTNYEMNRCAHANVKSTMRGVLPKNRFPSSHQDRYKTRSGEWNGIKWDRIDTAQNCSNSPNSYGFIRRTIKSDYNDFLSRTPFCCFAVCFIRFGCVDVCTRYTFSDLYNKSLIH